MSNGPRQGNRLRTVGTLLDSTSAGPSLSPASRES